MRADRLLLLLRYGASLVTASDDVQERADAARQAIAAAHKAVARRDEAIVSLHAEGASIRAIALTANLSPTAVAKILVRAAKP